MNNSKQIIVVIASSLILMALLAWWGGKGNTPDLLPVSETSDESFQAPLTMEEQENINPSNVNTMNPVAVIETTKGTFELELFTDLMPVTAGNFITLAENGYYDGIKFHRVIDGFMIQGGDPNTKEGDESSWGTGGPGYAIADEHIANPKLSNLRGTISMANSGPNSGGSQFFINTNDNTFLDFDKEPLSSKHPVFGRVIEGMDTIDMISTSPTGSRDIPVDPIVINKVTIRHQ